MRLTIAKDALYWNGSSVVRLLDILHNKEKVKIVTEDGQRFWIPIGYFARMYRRVE